MFTVSKRIRLWNYLVFPKREDLNTSVWLFKCRVPDEDAISRGPTIVQLRRSLLKNRNRGSSEHPENN